MTPYYLVEAIMCLEASTPADAGPPAPQVLVGKTFVLTGTLPT